MKTKKLLSYLTVLVLSTGVSFAYYADGLIVPEAVQHSEGVDDGE